MKYVKTLFSVFLFISLIGLLAPSEQNPLSLVEMIEASLDNALVHWKIEKQDVEDGEKALVDDSGWPVVKLGDSIQDKIFWLRHRFSVPKIFAGIKTQGSDIHLSCLFTGLGIIEGKFFRNGKLQENFTLEFGNHTGRIRKDFVLATRTQPGEKILLAFRFKNLGRLPLIERKEAEPGTFFQLEQACYRISAAQKAQEYLSRFLLDLKTGMFLLDFGPSSTSPSQRERPVCDAYRKFQASKEFQNLRKTFQKAVTHFDTQALHQGNFPKIKESLFKFYREVKPISRFSSQYTISAAGNSHIDLAWLWRWPETVEVAKQTFSTIMDNMEEYPHIVYVQSQAQVYEWMEEYYPEVFQRIKEKVKQGRWEIVGGMWAEPDCNLIDGESFIRQILYGKRYFQQKFGVDVDIGWNPDSFGYNWNMPQFFQKSGIHSFITQKISWNDTTVFPYFLFWWEGPDGSRILTYFPPTGYVGRLKAERAVSGLKKFERNTGQRNVLVLYGLGDHGGGPNRQMLNRAAGYQDQIIFPKIKHSTVAQFLDQLDKETLQSLPIWNDELYLEYHRGTYTTQAETKEFNRKSEVLLTNTEKISSMTTLFGRQYPTENLRKAWKKVLMNQFHDILPGSSIAPVYRDSREFYLEAMELAENELGESLLHLAQCIDTRISGTGTPLLVFNPLSWKRDGVVKVKLPSDFPPNIMVLNHKGENIPSQILKEGRKNILCFVAKEVPSLGYKLYNLQPGRSLTTSNELKAGETALENRYFVVNLHPETGNIISIFDKIEKKEILAPQACGNQLQLFEDRPDRWDAWNIQYTGRSWKLDQAQSITVGERGPAMVSLKVKKKFLGPAKARRDPTPDFPSSFFTQEIILYQGIPRIDINMKADWWEDHILLKVAFAVDVKNDSAAYEIPFASIQRPTTRNTAWEKARFEVPAIRWADLSDEHYGVSLLNQSKYGYDIKDHVMRLTLLRSPTWPDPMADRGKHQFSYALYPHPGDWREADTVQRGYEFNSPLLPLLVDSHPGELPPSYSFLRVSPSNVILAAVKKAEERESLILRVYEAEGRAAEALIEYFRKPKKVYALDLMENRLNSLSFRENSVELKLGKSEIKTIELVY
ncbi:MAG: alpha-mannosidase [Candidatus Aminicenantes bacterium]